MWDALPGHDARIVEGVQREWPDVAVAVTVQAQAVGRDSDVRAGQTRLHQAEVRLIHVAIAVGVRSRAFAGLIAGDTAASVASASELMRELLKRGALSNGRLLLDVDPQWNVRIGARHIGVDQQRPFSGLGEGEGQVGQHGRFAVAGGGAGEQQNFLVGRRLELSQVDAELTVVLAHQGIGGLTNDMVQVVALGFIVIVLGSILGPRRPTVRKLQPYESGMTPVGPGQKRMPIKFYLTAVLFILFDIEVVFFLPWAVVFRQLGLFGLIEMAVFIVILLVGYFYAWKKGALEWE